ncbi:MAG: hypothetical protein ACRCTZ_05080 [Sarcina sp.]
MSNLDLMKVLKVIGVIIIGYFVLNVLLTVLNIALGLAIKLLIVVGLTVGILYGIKMLKAN